MQAHEIIEHPARIRVIGVGGAGGNALNHMQSVGLSQVEFVAMNTDAQALARVHANAFVPLGNRITRGLGAGGDPAIGAHSAEESATLIAETIAGADLVFIALGLGGGTGTGAGPVVARIAKRMGALVVGVVTLPFAFEGRRRSVAAQAGLLGMREYVDTLITIPNDRLFQATSPEISLNDAFHVADEILRQAVNGLSELVTVPGLINLDFADLRTIMVGAGTALMAIGEASGADRAQAATKLALTSPLLGLDVYGAQGIIFNVTGGSDLTLAEVRQVAHCIQAVAHPDANLIFGAVTDESITGTLRVTLVATGLHGMPVSQPQSHPINEIYDPLVVHDVPTLPLGQMTAAKNDTNSSIYTAWTDELPSVNHAATTVTSPHLVVTDADLVQSAIRYARSGPLPRSTAHQRPVVTIPSAYGNQSDVADTSTTPTYVRRMWQ